MKNVTSEEMNEILKSYNFVIVQKIKMTCTYTYLLKNRVSTSTRNDFKKVRNIIDNIYKIRSEKFINTTI